MANTPPPVPTRSPLTSSDGLATRPWIAWFTTLGQLFGYNQQITSNGTPLPPQTSVNFKSPLTVTDDPANGTTDVGFAFPKLTQVSVSGSFGQAMQNNTGFPKFVFIAAYTGQGVGNDSAIKLSVGPTQGDMTQLTAAGPTNGPGWGTVTAVVPDGSWYQCDPLYGTLVIQSWTEMNYSTM